MKLTVNNPASIHLFKVNNRNIRTKCELCSKLTIKKPERRQNGPIHFKNLAANATRFLKCVWPFWHRSGVFIVNFERASHLVLVFLLLTLNMQLPAGKLNASKVNFCWFLTTLRKWRSGNSWCITNLRYSIEIPFSVYCGFSNRITY